MATKQVHMRIRYISALLLVAALISASAIILFQQFEEQKQDAVKINVSGMQRMLSQKIALYVLEAGETERDDLNSLHNRLSDAIITFEQNYLFLVKDKNALSPELHALYFDGSPNLEDTIKDYIVSARKALESSLSSDQLEPFSFSRIESLLQTLNRVVLQYEREANQRVESVEKIEAAIWLATIILLLIEALIIFYPMEKSIGFYIKQLEQQLLKNELLSQQKRQFEELTKRDPLTGLYSLRGATELFRVNLEKAKNEGCQVAVLFLDLDNFKPVNDRYGHDIGDKLLIKTANRISSQLRHNDFACRVGGDEFLIGINGFDDLYQLETICKRLIKSVSENLSIDHHEISIGVSIGCSVFPIHAGDLHELKRKADRAMYVAKEKGKNDYVISSE